MHNFTSKRKKKQIHSSSPDVPVWHFDGKNSIPTDVFGSYTGTPLMPERTAEGDDLHPIQDVDDL